MKFCIAIGKFTAPDVPLLLEGDFVQSMQTAKEIGYDAVEIHTPDPALLDTGILNNARSGFNMFIATLGTGMIYGKYGLHLMDEDNLNQDRLFGMLRQYIDIAKKIGSKITIGSVKGNYPKGEDKEKYLDIMGENLRRIADYAQQQDVTVLLEATNRFENNVLNTGKDVCEMIEKYELKNTEILLDSFHVNIGERDIRSSVLDCKGHLGHIHFGDNTRMYPGSGTFDFKAFCSAIKESGYDGVLSVECFPLPDGITAAKKTMEFFKRNF